MKSKKLVLCALFAALIAVCSQILIPISAIPINLALFAVWMCGAVLGWLYGSIAVITYIALGAIGIPVFTNFRGGIGVLAGPTGGYIVGYLVGVLLCGALIGRFSKTFWMYPVAMTLGCIVCYAFGTLWYMILTHTGLISALTMCVLPYLPGDVIKIILASLISYKLNTKLKSWI
ncbi:MAG: biotin transporter BioY [Clostridiales bacterium]|nr:biotin transporter BioY [Clostridiales bacterium]